MKSTGVKKSKGFGYAKYGYLFSLPFVIIFLVFSLYPTIYTALIGFTNLKGLGNSTWNFYSGADLFKNFNTILNNATFKKSIGNTLVIWITNFIPQIALALLLTAWFTSRTNKIKGQGFFKVVFYMPNIITAASVAILFYNLFAYPIGPINSLLQMLGLTTEAINFPILGNVSKGVVSFIQFWTWFGYTTIILISGVLGINPEIYEAADIDGANSVQTFFHITIPNLRTVLLYMLITSIIGGLNMYDIPKMYLNGGPDNATLTTSVFIYNQAFSGSYMYARAAAASMIMWLAIVVLSAIVFFLMRDKDAERERKMLRAARRVARQKALNEGGRA